MDMNEASMTDLRDRVIRTEVTLEHLATKAELNKGFGDLRVEMHTEFNNQTWKIITAVATIVIAAMGGMATIFYFIAKNVN
jgi:hypothetical protein